MARVLLIAGPLEAALLSDLYLQPPTALLVENWRSASAPNRVERASRPFSADKHLPILPRPTRRRSGVSPLHKPKAQNQPSASKPPRRIKRPQRTRTRMPGLSRT